MFFIQLVQKFTFDFELLDFSSIFSKQINKYCKYNINN